MNRSRTATRAVRYGRKLVNAGFSGVRIGQDTARGDQSLPAVAAEAAQQSLGPVVVGACIGLLTSCVMRRQRSSNAVALGTLGGAIGFLLGFGWRTRNVTSSVLNSAAKELRRVRDEHWLEVNPIDYA